ncbi:Ig-like domain-containing protein [Pseudoalteromonas phenolica]|uniref:Ig-like domain-containing protein n=2 Tax=Pseudoalteromonas phenolica TaxID=161398 RepID=UPI0019D4659D|nr:Ig-like domain-containing protein [Pseudoalteromonas phenolica]
MPSNDTYIAGENLEFTVNTSENVTVDTTNGTPSIAITVGSSTKNATYVSGSGSSALTFRYTVESGLVDSDGISVGALSTNSGTLKDTAGNDLTLTLNSVGATSNVLVDSIVPSVSAFNTSSLTLKSGETSQITIVLSESSSDFTIQDIAATNGNLSDFSGSGSSYSATFTPSSDIEGSALLNVNAGAFTDAAGNSNSASNQLSITIDTKAPSGQSVSIDQSVINKSNESALSFSLSGLESSGSFTYSITDGVSTVSSQSSTNITASTASLDNLDVTNLNEGTLTLSVTVTDSAGNSAQAITDTVTKSITLPLCYRVLPLHR